MYKDKYTYTPPPTAQEKICTFQCDKLKLQCVEIEELKAKDCIDDAKPDYDECLMETQNKWECDPLEPHTYCNTAIEKCNEEFNQCYQICGGKVEKKTECIANCI